MLAIDYRPKTFSEVVGQDLPKEVLKQIALADGIKVRAILLHGAYGSGKSTLARIFGKAMNCPEFQKTGEVCNKCEHCRSVNEGTSQAYLEYDSTRVGNVDDIKSLIDRLQIKNFQGRRVVCIDEVHSCLDFRTPILTTQGAVEIYDIVESGVATDVKSVDFTTGEIVEKPIVGRYNNGQDQNTPWYRIQWNGGVARCTANHNFYKNGLKVQASCLKTGDRIDAVEWCLSEDAEQVLIGTLLGDSSFDINTKIIGDSIRSKSLAYVERLDRVAFSQGEDQIEYLKWKASLFPFGKWYEQKRSGKSIYSYKFTMRQAQAYKSLHSTRTTFKDLKAVIDKIGPLAMLVWYLDDGHYNKNNFVELSCTNFGEEGAQLMLNKLEALGCEPRLSRQVDKRSSKVQLKLRLTVRGTKMFMSYISGLVDIDCINYKIPKEYRGVRSYTPCEYKLSKESALIQVRQMTADDWNDGYKGSNKYRRFNIEVEDTHNYVLPGGVVSANCSKQAQTALLKVLEEGVTDTVFVFATTDNVIKTIESRSVKLDFQLIAVSELKRRVLQVAEAESIKITEDQAEAVAIKAQGHARNAMQILEQFAIAGEESLRTSYKDLRKYIVSCLQKKPSQDSLLNLLQYPLVDIRQSVYQFLNSCFTSQEKLFETIRQKGLANKLFKFFYAPEAVQALKDEFGTEILLRSLAESL